jgi:hypothetical protein
MLLDGSSFDKANDAAIKIVSILARDKERPLPIERPFLFCISAQWPRQEWQTRRTPPDNRLVRQRDHGG